MVEDGARPSFRLESQNPLIFFIHSYYWWLDLGVNVHVCFDHSWFSIFQKSSSEGAMLGNDSLVQVSGRDRVDLKMTFGKTLIVLHNL